MSKTRRREQGEALITTLSFDYAHGYTIPEHAHREHQLALASHGVMTVATTEGTWAVPPMRAIWIPAGVRHSIDMSGQVALRTLYVPLEALPAGPQRCLVVAVNALLRELVLHVVERGELDLRQAAGARLYAVILDQLTAIPQASLHLPSPRDPRARKLASYLMAHPEDAQNLTALARRAGASERTLERLFVRDTGLSFREWRRRLRFARAMRQLADGQSVTNVATECGYRSTSAFVFAFRTTFGVTPARYFTAEAAGG